MHKKLRQSFTITSLLLALGACTQNNPSPLSSSQELNKLEQEYLLLQKENRELQTQLKAFKQVHESSKLRSASDSNHNDDLEQQLLQAQKKLTGQNHEYQSLLTDYAVLESSIAPLASRLQASIAAHRKELIGTKLGTVVLKNDRQLHQVEVTDVNDDSLHLKFSDGWTWIKSGDLPLPIQQRFFYKPILVSPSALLSETPEIEPLPSTQPSPAEQAKALITAAFAERNRQALAKAQASLKNRIPELEKKISKATQQIQYLKLERKDVTRKFSRPSKIKRSSIDRNKALNKIDLEIRKLDIAIQAANLQIKNWKQELIRNASDE